MVGVTGHQNGRRPRVKKPGLRPSPASADVPVISSTFPVSISFADVVIVGSDTFSFMPVKIQFGVLEVGFCEPDSKRRSRTWGETTTDDSHRKWDKQGESKHCGNLSPRHRLSKKWLPKRPQ
jgi:hypothetical protein